MEKVEKFVKEVYNSLVKEDEEVYRDLFNNTDINDDIIPYWKDALKLYSKLSDNDREIFFKVIKQITIDTISSLFGIIDGCTTIDDKGIETKLLLGEQDTEGELLDLFLAYVEEIEQMEEK